MLRTVVITRYVTPLREGGSLPAVVEADDDGLYVLKFRGAGQGHKALIAELVAGEIGRVLGLAVPEIVLCDLDPVLGRAEPDPEIRDLIKASAGLNLALDYLPGAVAFDPLVGPPIPEQLASLVVWFDAFVTNVDRTARNTNLLVWHKRLWLIDHGAALYVHHTWADRRDHSRRPFKQIKDHVLLRRAADLHAADRHAHAVLTSEQLTGILALVPALWLMDDAPFATPEAARAAYVDYLVWRLDASRIFVEEAEHARAQLI